MAIIQICKDSSFVINDDELNDDFNYDKLAEHLCKVFPEISSYEFVHTAFKFINYIEDVNDIVESADRPFEFALYMQELDLNQFFN